MHYTRHILAKSECERMPQTSRKSIAFTIKETQLDPSLLWVFFNFVCVCVHFWLPFGLFLKVQRHCQRPCLGIHLWCTQTINLLVLHKEPPQVAPPHGQSNPIYKKWRNLLQYGRGIRTPGSTIKWITFIKSMARELVKWKRMQKSKMAAIKRS